MSYDSERVERNAEKLGRQDTADKLLYEAWGVIANAGWDGLDKSEGWQDAAVRWRDRWHVYLEGAHPGSGEEYRMSLREKVINAGAEEMHGDVFGAEVVLDAFLDVLSEHADEWRYTSRIDGSGHRETIIPKLLAVLREDAT